MKIVVRCNYYLPVNPNFFIIDLRGEELVKFLRARENIKERIEIIRPYIRKPGTSYIIEVAWIPLENLKLADIKSLKEICENLYVTEPIRTY